MNNFMIKTISSTGYILGYCVEDDRLTLVDPKDNLALIVEGCGGADNCMREMRAQFRDFCARHMASGKPVMPTTGIQLRKRLPNGGRFIYGMKTGLAKMDGLDSDTKKLLSGKKSVRKTK